MANDDAELAAVMQRIDARLSAWGDRNLTQEHFDAQIVSFIVGNAFDVFDQVGTVTERTVHDNFSSRLDIRR